MIGKNNKYLRDTKGGVKVESYSIKKFKVGAASVVIGASIFFGAGIANAGEVVEKNTEIEKLEGANDKVSPDKEVLKSAKEEVKPAKKEELASGNTPAVNNNVNTEKTVEKQALDKTKLQTNIEKVEELLEKINKDKAPASTLAAIKIDLENAKNALNNNELTQAEVDAVAKKLNEKIFVLSSMPKANTPEKVVKEGKNSIANSGSRDSRNNQRMGEGVRFRADDTRVEGPLYDVKEYISEDKYNGGGTTTNQRVRTIEKTFMTAKYSTEGNKKFITYEVYFQNDGKALDGATGNAFWFYPPRDLLYNVGGNYPVGVVSDAYYERYEKKAGTTGILSHNPNNFTQVGGRYTVSLSAGKTQDYGSQSLWGSAGGIFQFDGGPARRSPSQVQSMLKNLKDNKELNSIIRLGNGNLPDGSYSHILNVSPKQNYAYKYHVKMRLRDDVTAEQARTAGTIAVTTKAGSATNALQAYVYAATGTSLLAPPTINTLTKYDGTLVSTDRVISGTGVAGATITLTMQDGTPRTIHVDNSGRWSYTLKQNEKLTQNTRQDASIKSPNTISAKQTKNGEESSATAVNVQLARAISIDTPLQAGRDISVKVAHDTGRFYIQVRNAANTATVYEYGVIQENGRWRIENSTAANAIDVKVTDGDTPSEKKITLHVNDSHRKNNIPFKITKDHVVRVRSHHVNDANIAADPGHENDGWVTANKATNTNPTIAIKDSNATYTSDGTLTKDKLKTLVTVNDAEDTPGKTVGNTAAENLDVTATKDGKNVDLTKPLKQGTYNLTYRTTDAAGAIATKNHTITVNYAAVAKSKINLVQGERISDEIKRSLLELRDGNDKVAIPNNARVEVTLDTSAKADSKTAVASVVLQGKTIASTNINYRVLPTFPIAHTVYDFKGVNRSDDESKYYLNTGIPGGMKWFAKRGNEAEIDASGLRDKINADPVGETTYKFGGKYNYGRFTDSPQPNEKLEHAATFTHKVFDIKPNDTKVTVAQGGTLSEAQAISAVAKVTGSPDLPSGTTYEWVDDRGNKITPTANTAGVQNFKVKVTLPQAQSGNDAPEATKRQPSKIITVPVNVTPPAPTVTTEPRYSGTLVSTDRSISGRGIAGATITVTLQDGTTGTTLVNNQGEWTYNLKTNEKLTQNTKKDASIKADKEITVKQSKDGVESSATSVNVQLARVISINTPVQAGREITVKVPHDAGQFYVQLNYDTRQVYEYGVKQENGQWKITDPNKANTTELIVKNGDNVSEKELTLRIKDSNKKTNIPFTIPSGENKLRVRVHHVNGQNNPANPANEPGQGWVIASEATNESPTITVKEPTKTAYTADGSLTMAGLKKLVTVADKEDDADKTVGNRASDNFTLTVKQGANVVDLSNNKYLKKGTYTLTYTTRDAAGATARKEHTITVNYTAEAKPTINLIQGETLTEAEKRTLLQLQDGTSKINVPSDARVEVTLDTSSPSDTNKTASATVVFADNTRTAPININYKVYKKFETVTKVYDFAGVGRNDSPASYYLNPGGLPGGMSWVVKRDNDAEFKNADADMKNMLNSDGVGTKTYSFGAKYPRGRFTDSPSEAEKLSYTPTFTHEVFDVGANTTRVMVKSGTALADSQAKDAVMAVNGSQSLPEGTTYEWVNQDGTPLANKTVTEKGEATRYVKVTLPKVSETGPNANKVRSSKIVTVTINESEKPKVSFDGRELSTDARNENSKFVIFRGSTFDPTFTVSDNTGKVTEVKASGLPSGREFVKNTDTPNGNIQITGDQITATSNATLGDHIGKVLVKDASGNEQEYQFKYTVVDIKTVENPKAVPINTKLGDSHFHVKLVNSDATDATSQEGLYPNDTKFKWKKENNGVSNETVLSEPGKITGYKAVVESPTARAGFYTKNGVKIYMPATIERDITFLVQPTAPTVKPKDNGDVEVTNENQQNVDKIKVTYTKQEGATPVEVTYTATKKATGWEVEAGAPLTIDSTTGTIKISDAEVRDKTSVRTKAITTDDVESTEANGTAKGSVITLKTPEVSFKAAKDKNAQGSVPASENNSIFDKLVIPAGDPVPTGKAIKDNGSIKEVDGKKTVTVVLTYADNTTKEVTVPVLEVKPIDITTTFNELDNTVTVKPNTTVENGDKLHVTIRGVGMQLTKTATGYTNSRNDRDITVNSDGSITINLLRNETFQAGDRVVTRHESNKNGKVDSYETEAFAGLKPVEKVPVLEVTALTNKEKEDVKAAVKRANPSVNTAELEVAANGDVTYRHKGAGVGTSDPTPVITLSQTVRERNDAEKIDPTIATLTRYVKETKHTDEQIKNAITGEHIANKEITGEIPTNGGTVVVKVTYTDGSSEDVKVPIIVTPELTPVKNLNNLTNKEKESVKAKIQTLNPIATNIVVKNNGETTLTIPDVTTAPLTPAQTVKEADSNRIQPPAVTPVKNTGALTPEEKGKVVEAVKKVNPKATKVEVGEDGSTTVTFEDGTTAPLTPDKTVVEDFEPAKPTEKLPVKDKGHLTPEEKKQVADKVKDKNPGKEVTVGEDGTATVTDPTTGISHTIPGTDLVNQDFEPVKPTEKVPVKDKAHLTPEEKKQVADKVKDKNPGKEVTVGDDGTATVTDPTTGISHTIPGTDLTIIVPPVVDIPEFNGAVNGELPDPVELPKVKLIITKWADEQGNELKPADAKTPSKLGEPNEAYEHGTIPGYEFVRTEINSDGDVVTHIFRKVTSIKPEGNGEEQGGNNKPQSTPTSPKVDENIKPKSTAKVEKSTKRLANTGESETNTGLAGLGLAMLGSLLAVVKRRREDEE